MPINFALTQPAAFKSYTVWLNGEQQTVANGDFTITGSTLTFNPAKTIVTGDVIQVW